MAVEVGPIKCLRPPIGKPRPARAGAVSLGPTHSWLCSGLGFHPTNRGRVPTPDLAFLSPAGSMDRSGVPLDGLRLELTSLSSVSFTCSTQTQSIHFQYMEIHLHLL
jgi:hypothetical protein